jgi:hypothetical protein
MSNQGVCAHIYLTPRKYHFPSAKQKKQNLPKATLDAALLGFGQNMP